MIASIPQDIWKFESKYKQSVSDYFKTYPAGTYDHFLDEWPRAHQVSRPIFNEVYVKLQKAGAIRIIEGGEAHKQLIRDIEKRTEQRLREEQQAAWPAPTTPEPTPALPTNGVKQEPLNYPNAETPPTPQKESMAKEWSLAELQPEERKTLDTILQAHPQIEYEDLCKKIGYTLKHSVYYSTLYAIKSGRYNFPGIYGSQKGKVKPSTSAPAPRAVIPHSPVSNGHIPLVNYTRISGQQIVGPIDTEGHTKEEIKTMQNWLPTVLTEILDRKMQFKVVKYTEEDDDGKEKVTLEVRRIA